MKTRVAVAALVACFLLPPAASAQQKQWYMTCPACAQRLGGAGIIGPFKTDDACQAEYTRHRAENFPVGPCQLMTAGDAGGQQAPNLLGAAMGAAALIAPPGQQLPAMAAITAIGVLWGALDDWGKERQVQAAHDRAMAIALQEQIEAEKRRIEEERQRKLAETRQYLLANLRGLDSNTLALGPRTLEPSAGFKPKTTADLERATAAAATVAPDSRAHAEATFRYFSLAPIAVVGLDRLHESTFFYRLQRAPLPGSDLSPIKTGRDMISRVPELARSSAVALIIAGADAVIAHDWRRALDRWKLALRSDPNNRALQRSVDMAQWMVDRESGVTRPADSYVQLANTLARQGRHAGAFAFLIVGTKNDNGTAASLIADWDRRLANDSEYVQARADYYEARGIWPSSDPRLIATLWASNGSFEGAFATLRSAAAADPNAARQTIALWDAQFAMNPRYREMRELFYDTTGATLPAGDFVQFATHLAARGGIGYQAGLAVLLKETGNNIAARARVLADWDSRFGADPEWKRAHKMFFELQLEADRELFETILLENTLSSIPPVDALRDAPAERSNLEATVRERLTSLPDEIPGIAESPAAEKVRLGNSYALANDWPRALALFQEARRLDPQNREIQTLVSTAGVLRDIFALNDAPNRVIAAASRPPVGIEDDEETVKFLTSSVEFCRGPRMPNSPDAFLQGKPDCELQWMANHKNDDPKLYLSRRNAEHLVFAKSVCNGSTTFMKEWPVAVQRTFGAAAGSGGPALYGFFVKNGSIAIDNPYLNLWLRSWKDANAWNQSALDAIRRDEPQPNPYINSPGTWAETKWGMVGMLECLKEAIK